MGNIQQCECEICKKHREIYVIHQKKNTFHSIQEGDYIKVFSGGMYIGIGTFLSIENNVITWIDKENNWNVTHINGINIRKFLS